MLFSHYSAHIMRSQSEWKAGFLKEFLLSRSWIDERMSLKWKLDWRTGNDLLTRSRIDERVFC